MPILVIPITMIITIAITLLIIFIVMVICFTLRLWLACHKRFKGEFNPAKKLDVDSVMGEAKPGQLAFREYVTTDVSLYVYGWLANCMEHPMWAPASLQAKAVCNRDASPDLEQNQQTNSEGPVGPRGPSNRAHHFPPTPPL